MLLTFTVPPESIVKVVEVAPERLPEIVPPDWIRMVEAPPVILMPKELPAEAVSVPPLAIVILPLPEITSPLLIV